ncbi:DNA helicase PcrA [Vallitalea okinawensis]|uniref:DNA helicase PcrA n=1 Tax=Vallitalea okinawensis TaxID=2078660 RepID=UPI000CFB05FF|nr:DNA helicase PcrA [Vallitalea okinawensis]
MVDISTLNEMQRKAVLQTEGPVLILAGAGSGKTRVLTHRIAYILEEKNVMPYNILAITFTNKAATEMKERVASLVGDQANEMWVSTFHSACVRILRAHIDKLGYDRSFVIYDTEDQKGLMKQCIKELNMNEKNFNPRSMIGEVSSAKNELLTPKQYETEAMGDFRKEQVARIYKLYQEKLFSNNALDFDDIIFRTVELFRCRPDVLERYQDRFRYIMVDEYQDTNTAQYKFIRLLAGKHKNLCVVGDDDQSIYKFRGANIRNILDFEKDFENSFVVRLEQNYRCTKKILDAANYVIRNNSKRKSKTLWTDNKDGDLITVFEAENERNEAGYIADQIIKGIEDDGYEYNDYAILYRTNAQSRAIEESFMVSNIPYRLYGGVAFYQRKEVKDILCYLKTISNSKDDIAVKRIINVPKRGIGAASVNKVDILASQNDMDFFAVLRNANEFSTLGRASTKLFNFANFMLTLKMQMNHMSLVKFVEHVIDEIAYKEYLKKDYPEDYDSRIENINELISKVAEYEERVDDPDLAGLLEEIALVAAIDSFEGDNRVSLMTLHSAKGLEFPRVFLAGVEDGVFPSYMSIVSEDETDIEEERRLCYVGITRAEHQLYLTHARCRMVKGLTQFSKPSRFLREIPEELLQFESASERPSSVQMHQSKSFNNSMRTNNFKKRYQTEKPGLTFGNVSEKDLFLQPGDLVKHKKFGTGTVKKVESGGADLQVTIYFMKVGEKKLLAKLAGIKKIDD